MAPGKALLIPLTLLVACSEPALQNASVTEPIERTISDYLQGDWATATNEESYDLHQILLRVDGELFGLFSDYSDSVSFRRTDSLVTLGPANVPDTVERQQFRILEFSDDSLILHVQSSEVLERLRLAGWKSDTLHFRKLKVKNNLSPVRIGFASSGCNGNCHPMKLEIAANREVQFRWTGDYRYDIVHLGILEEILYQTILRQIRQLPLATMQNTYSVNLTHQQTRYLFIETKDSLITTSAYGKFSEPPELAILLDNLIDLHNRIAWSTQDSSRHIMWTDTFELLGHPVDMHSLYDQLE